MFENGLTFFNKHAPPPFVRWRNFSK